MKNLKNIFFSSLLIIFSSICLANPQSKLADSVIVVVNDGVILQSDINTALANIKMSGVNAKQLPAKNILYRQIVDQLIMERLQLQQASKIGLQIDDARLDQAITNIAKKNKISLSQLRRKIARSGMTYSQYREQIRKEMTISDARSTIIRRRINILPQEVEQLAKKMQTKKANAAQYNLSHILIRTDFDSKTASVEKQQEAQQLVSKLKDGANFTKLAYKYSAGPKALKGGKLGWMNINEMPSVFTDSIYGAKKGDIIGPLKSGAGYHILKINNIKGLKFVAATEIKSRHILLKTSIIFDDNAAKNKLLEIRKDIISKQTTFAKMAAQYSQDTTSATQGGDLNWQIPEIFVPEFKQKLETLPLNTISTPFKTVHGWHIVEVKGRRTVDKTDVSNKNQAYRMLINRKFNEETQTWLQELRASAYIKFIK